MYEPFDFLKGIEITTFLIFIHNLLIMTQLYFISEFISKCHTVVLI